MAAWSATQGILVMRVQRIQRSFIPVQRTANRSRGELDAVHDHGPCIRERCRPSHAAQRVRLRAGGDTIVGAIVAMASASIPCVSQASRSVVRQRDESLRMGGRLRRDWKMAAGGTRWSGAAVAAVQDMSAQGAVRRPLLTPPESGTLPQALARVLGHEPRSAVTWDTIHPPPVGRG